MIEKNKEEIHMVGEVLFSLGNVTKSCSFF